MSFRFTRTIVALGLSAATASAAVTIDGWGSFGKLLPVMGPDAPATEARPTQPAPELDLPERPAPAVVVEKPKRPLRVAAPVASPYVAKNIIVAPIPSLPSVVSASVSGRSVLSSPDPVSLGVGSATINYDKSGWDALAADIGGPNVLTLDEFFDLPAVTAKNYNQILHDEVQATPSYTGQVYPMNGPTVTNIAVPAPARTNQPTTFEFQRGNVQGHTGSIGLGGISRFAVSPSVGGGKLLYGDFTILYDPYRIELGGTGWYLKGNIAPVGPAFDILNVNVVETTDTLTISGDLGVTFEIANLLYSTPADAGRDVGDFTFTATIVPEPTTSALLLACLGLVTKRCRRTLTA